MQKIYYLFIILLIIPVPVLHAKKQEKNRNSLIIGSDTTQKIYYSASSEYGRNHGPRKAIDSDPGSEWISDNEGDKWIEINFGIKRIMDRIVVYPGKKDNFDTISGFTVQFMYDNEWFNFAETDIPVITTGKFFRKKKKPAEKVEIHLGGIDASKFRVVIPEEKTYNGYAAISEIEVYIGSNKLKYFDERLMGMCMPVPNGLLPKDDSRYPNAPRKYRGGIHVGLDILHYHHDETYEPLPLTKETPILAAKDGVIIRADWDHKAFTVEEWLDQSDYYKKNPGTFIKRSFGGIQVWIDHQDGIVTTYNHLSKIAEGIVVGAKVVKGQEIGLAGNSGLMGEAENKDYGVHLHFEIWVDGYYLGRGMRIEDIRQYFTWIFLLRD